MAKKKAVHKSLLSFVKNARKRKNPLVLSKIDTTIYNKKRLEGLISKDRIITSRLKKVLMKLLRKHPRYKGRVKIKYHDIIVDRSSSGIAYISIVHGKMKLSKIDLSKIIEPRNQAEAELLKKLKPSSTVVNFRLDYWPGKGYDFYVEGVREIRDGYVKFRVHGSEKGTDGRISIARW